MRFFRLVLAVSFLFGFSNTGHAQNCNSGASNYYSEYNFGETLSALRNGCTNTLGPRETVFIGGFFSSAFKKNCPLGISEDEESEVSSFVQATVFEMTGNPFSNQDPIRQNSETIQKASAFSAGQETFDKLGGCGNHFLPIISRGLYVYVTNLNSNNVYIDSCTGYEGGSNTDSYCKCLVKYGSKIIPNIASHRFDPSFSDMVGRNPLVAAGIMMQCKLEE
ncbi:hypothetical protein F1188_02680 [Roseospira marina]|uniref:Uncharacterized protein n=1 Tax=Roseospira marina TaxID=140057 RepID=A0A5M6IF32_9PROT|nr:hypothetical protein [Roseospira marina]KAA5606843.1 hypothetical protein F1188_02680 [Roseospira marina]MBB4312994.1 hypothetical protein [Roseospira marina]MBB5086232.1 hypothetical protein [Roseospira marina]